MMPTDPPIDPDRVLSPRQTAAFEEMVRREFGSHGQQTESENEAG
jgi:hypothetical protein